jgi:hypothetical protein
MGVPFPEQVAPGGVLVFPQIQSPNFVHGSSGWSVNKDGSAEFNDLSLRGTFNGLDFVINSDGEFWYSGTPGPGNLLASIAATPGTDEYGNSYQAGFCVYNGTGYLQLHVNPAYPAPAAEMPTGVKSEQDHASLYAFSPNPGAAAEHIIAWLQGPASSSDGKSAAISLTSSTADGSGEANGTLFYTGVPVAYWDGAGVHVPGGALYGGNGVLPVGDSVAYLKNSGTATPFSGALHVSKTAQNTSPPVTGTSFTRLSNVWSLPQNDPAQETVYRVTTRGTVTTPSSGGPVFQARMNAWNQVSEPVSLWGAAYNGGAVFSFEVTGEVMVLNPGAGTATLYFCMKAVFTVEGANSTGLSAAQNSLAIVQNSFVQNADTTISNPNLTIQAAWSAADSGQGTSQWWDTFERFGEVA